TRTRRSGKVKRSGKNTSARRLIPPAKPSPKICSLSSPGSEAGTLSTQSTTPPEPPTKPLRQREKRLQAGLAHALSYGKPRPKSGCRTRSSTTSSPPHGNTPLSLSELRRMDLTSGCSNLSARDKWLKDKSSRCALFTLQRESSTLLEGYNHISPLIQSYLQTTCPNCGNNFLVSLQGSSMRPTPWHIFWL